MMIARNEGILDQDNDNRIKEILSTAAMYHDIGRVLDNGPHAARGARKIKKMDLKYSDGKPYSEEDKKIVMALVESHEGKPDKINKMIKKYGIKEEDIDLVTSLNSVVRDADALDRVRIDSNRTFSYKVDLNPKFLVNDTSKRLINSAYQLEFLSKRVPNMNNILRFGKPKTNMLERMQQENREFNEGLIVENQPVIAVEREGQNTSKQQVRDEHGQKQDEGFTH